MLLSSPIARFSTNLLTSVILESDVDRQMERA